MCMCVCVCGGGGAAISVFAPPVIDKPPRHCCRVIPGRIKTLAAILFWPKCVRYLEFVFSLRTNDVIITT